MPLTIVSTNDTDGIVFAEGTDITVLAGVTVSATALDVSALQVSSATYNGGQINILGTLVADHRGIDIFSNLNFSNSVNGSTIYIGATGQIIAGEIAIALEDGITASPIINYGEVFGNTHAIFLDTPSVGAGAFSIQNHGTMSAFLEQTFDISANLSGSIVNTGVIANIGSANVIEMQGGGALDLNNSGTISASGDNALVSASNTTLNNSGEIDGNVVINAVATIANNGLITGDVTTTGTATIANTGLITGDVSATGAATMTNTGTINGDVTLSGFADTYIGIGQGVVTGEIDLGNGDDTATLGNVGGVVRGGFGADTITGGADADEIYGDNQNDLIRGRTGDDIIDGGSGNDTLRAGQGDDEIMGGTGDDFIRGGAGEDIITGGQGLDIIFGGPGADTFVYLTESDSPDDNSARDIIQDFEAGDDIIDFTAFAGLSYAGTTAFSGTGPSFYVSDPNVIGRVKIFVDTDGDGTADMKIILNNVTTALTEDDFLF
ncbi:MAG: calcium-binding protein [Sulfitobacter sp.]